MKIKNLPFIISVISLLSVPKINFGQVPNLGTAANFILFTISGAIGNTGGSMITGNIGTNNGAITGFGAATVIGTIYNADDVTAQCSIDLQTAYDQLNSMIPTSGHIPVLGNGETLFAGIYSIAAAGSVAGVLTLDAQGDSNAVFIFKIGGAFTTAASTKVDLINGASAENVFWIAEGAIAMAASTTMNGTLISHNGAISMAAGGTLHGRMFSTTGAVSIDAVSAVAASIQLSCPIFNYHLAPNFGSAANFLIFTGNGAVDNTGVSDIIGNIGSHAGAITGFGAPSIVHGTLHNNDAITAQCLADLQSAYLQVSSIPATNTTHTPAFGSGETLFAGVYSIGAAGSVTGMLTLDAQGDPNAIFIFKIGGAFTTGASTTIILADGASSCNIFWIAEGAISLATNTSMKGTLIAHPGAVSMGAGCNLEGRIFSTTGAISVYGLSASTPTGCSLVTSWTGAAGTTDWFTTCNWDRGIPDSNMEALIPSTLLAGRVFPIINTGVASVDTITIQNAGALTVTNSTLQIKGAIINHGLFNASNGTIEMTGTFGQVLTENSFQNNAINHLIISNSSDTGVSLGGALDLYGSLIYSGTGMTLRTNDLLTLKSTALHTAWTGDMSRNFIIGKVTVEKYISARKAWRLLSIPTNSVQTIKQAWQEGATNTGSNPIIGYGTQITSNRPTWLADGFDMYSANGPSMKTYNIATASWDGVANTNIALISSTIGYMTFIRGDRTSNLFNSIPTETVLRTTGYLNTGDQDPIPADPGKFASIGNPYASALDMRYITKAGMKEFFYVWDPNLGGSNGLGGYQTFSFVENNYVITPGLGSYGPGGTVSNYIYSGHAFLIQSTLAGGSLTFKEDSKCSGSDPVSLTAGLIRPQLRTNLYGIKAGNSEYLVDGVLNNFDSSFSNDVNDMDAVKPVNAGENLSIKTGSNFLVIERRHCIAGKDTIFLNLTNTRVQKYRFELIVDQLNNPGTSGVLEDSHLQTSTPLNLNGSTLVDFDIENIPGSYAPDRFRIVFNQLVILPVTFTALKAWRKNSNINIEWTVENEINIVRYETEKSNDGIQFTRLAVTAASGNSSGSANYIAKDEHPYEGYNYYRIKSLDLNGKTAYTPIVKVLVGKVKPQITTFPNPVIDGTFSIQLNNMPVGNYGVRLLNNLGQVVISQIIKHAGGSSTELISIDKNMPHGIYQLNTIEPGGNTINMNLVY